MVDQDRRKSGRLAAAILVTGLTIAGVIFASSYLGTWRTVTETTAITTLIGTNGTSRLYQVEFLQESNCPYGSWLVPWAVVLDGQTVVQPSNATLPLSYDGALLTGDSDYSAIQFSLPDGTYSYTIIPKNFGGVEQSGSVTIDGSDAVVQVYAFITAMGCSSVTASG